MSEPLQFGYHPDADQISAFVEQALPAHEREQMLDHLAVCPECRTIVTLSLPEVDDPAPPLSVAPRKPWWAGWTLAWPVAGALAAGAFFVVSIRHAAIVPNATEQQVAVARSAAVPAPQEQSPAPAAKSTHQRSQAPPSSNREASAGFAAVAPKSSREAPRAAQSVGGLILKGRNLDALRRPGEASSTSRMASSMPARNLAGTPNPGLSSGIPGSVAGIPSPVAEARPQEFDRTQPTAKSEPSGQTATDNALMPAGADTGAAINGAPVETGSSAGANLGMAQDAEQVAQLKQHLPSHRPVLSMATQAERVIAIDSAYAVYVSEDAGQHWKAIQAPWQGRAVKAALVALPAAGLGAARLRKNAIATAHQESNASTARNIDGALVAQPAAPSAASGSSLSGTVTDMTGAVIQGASLTITDIATGTARTVTTGGNGRYLINGLAPGNYRVEAQSAGFRKQELESVAVSASGPSFANLSLTVGSATQAVTVQAEASPAQASDRAFAKLPAPSQPAPVFEIVTDSGDHWTSADGVTWKHM